MDLFSHQVNIRKRRSQRLCCQSPSSPKKECLGPISLGDFSKIPLEIAYTIFSYLNVSDMSKLILTSKEMTDYVEEYRTSKQGRRKFLMEYDTHHVERTENWPSDIIHSFFRLGLYMKRSSFLKSTAKRLKHITYHLNQLVCNKSCGDGRKCISFYCYGTFLHTLIAGWDDVECHRVYHYVHQTSPVNRYLTRILSAKPGELPHLEVFVRCFYRRAFIDVLRKKEDKAFWLNTILKSHPIIHQARILQILFLPKTNVGVNFNAAVYDRLEVTALLELGQALLLLSEHTLWTDNNIISVMDEIFALPHMWHPQNISSLLLNSGDDITLKVLVSKAINNRFTEVVCIAHHLLVASVKAFHSIKKASHCIWAFVEKLKIPDRIYVATELVASFKDAMYDIVDIGNEPVTELEAVIEATSQFTQDILDLALDAIKQNKLPNMQYTKVSKQPDSETSLTALAAQRMEE